MVGVSLLDSVDEGNHSLLEHLAARAKVFKPSQLSERPIIMYTHGMTRTVTQRNKLASWLYIYTGADAPPLRGEENLDVKHHYSIARVGIELELKTIRSAAEFREPHAAT